MKTTSIPLLLGLAIAGYPVLAAEKKLDISKIDVSKLPSAADRKGVTYAKDIRPIFEASCFRCHGEERQKGDLRLDSLEAALKGGEDGKVIVPGASKKSLLVIAAARIDDETAMPPKPKPGGPGNRPGGGRYCPGAPLRPPAVPAGAGLRGGQRELRSRRPIIAGRGAVVRGACPPTGRRILEKYRGRICTFNDDMQGTGAITLAAAISAVRVCGTPLRNQRVVIFGAGTAGIGVASWCWILAPGSCGAVRLRLPRFSRSCDLWMYVSPGRAMRRISSAWGRRPAMRMSACRDWRDIRESKNTASKFSFASWSDAGVTSSLASISTTFIATSSGMSSRPRGGCGATCR